MNGMVYLKPRERLRKGKDRKKHVCVFISNYTNFEHAYTEMSLWIDTTANKIVKISFLSSQSRGQKIMQQGKISYILAKKHTHTQKKTTMI